MAKKKTETAQVDAPKTETVNRPGTLTAAILQVMKECKSVEKNLSVGVGNASYKGVSDKDVKQVIQPAMVRAGLVILPIKIEPVTRVDRWEETTNYGVKKKQQVFTETKVTFHLMHESGEGVEIVGYGHGIDSQDKSAGKAMTYALKYALLYTFLIPTGQIDDADATHSNDIATPGKQKPNTKQALNADQFKKALDAINKGNYTVKELTEGFALTTEQTEQLNNINA